MDVRGVIMLGLGVALAGCQAEERPQVAGELDVASVQHHFVETDCPAQRCAEVKVGASHVPAAPAFSDEVRSRLLTLGQGLAEEPVQAQGSDTWETYAEAFFQQAKAERALGP